MVEHLLGPASVLDTGVLDYPQPLPSGRQQPCEGDSLVNKELRSEWDSTGESGCSSTIIVSETRSVRGGGTEK